ncbi:MBL fold metallo-hydrolase [Lysobacter sp. A3-1-A15]|uniref:MBL fold metallo-hydrolase n=1 Tax=Novilysobacter viscosus TaxID=3098602 RepID=UPI002EDAEF27
MAPPRGGVRINASASRKSVRPPPRAPLHRDGTVTGAGPDSGFALTFLGAAGTVTGSRYLVETPQSRVLVDCGLFQGYKPLRLKNWAPFPIEPDSIDAVVLTHAHLDHAGYLPRLVAEGFSGPVWCSRATRDLCGIMLPDSARLLEEEASHANRVGSSKHHPAKPLYDERDAALALRQLKVVEFGAHFAAAPGLVGMLRPQGHILGAGAVTLEHGGMRVTFSGDVGRPDDPVMPAPEPPADSDWIVCESTYGDRRHLPGSLRAELKPILAKVVARGGTVVIPAFAVGRAQALLHVVCGLVDDGELPPVPLYLNSPMAARVTALYRDHLGGHRLDATALDRMDRLVRTVSSVEESKALNARKGPKVIVSASGMLSGGRVLHHLLAFAGDPRNAIVLCGYQAGGTRGAALARGERRLRVYGVDLDVRAEVFQLDTGSAHADADELIAWLDAAPRQPRGVLLSHGEPDAADALRQRVERELGWPASVPEFRDRVDLMGVPSVPRPPARPRPATD